MTRIDAVVANEQIDLGSRPIIKWIRDLETKQVTRLPLRFCHPASFDPYLVD